ncbi:MAG: sulfite exporter TauE/SafE family protein [Proteobacteria bacterium]|nr:sulfite exporter TauE/SafE family protein [Pseudomonadota bacterium]
MIYSLTLTMVGVLAAAVLRGFTGFGFGLAAVPLLSLALPPAEVVPLVVSLQVVVGLGGLRGALHQCDWGSVRRLVPGQLLGVPLGVAILLLLPPDPVRLLIGAMIGLSVLLLHRGARLPRHPSRLLTAAVGLLAGIISGFASMGGPPIIVYLMARGHTPQRLRATAIVYFFMAGCVTAIPMVVRHLITLQTLLWTAACLPVLFGGSWLGTLAFGKAQPRHHRLTALVTLSGLAVLLIGRTLWSMVMG